MMLAAAVLLMTHAQTVSAQSISDLLKSAASSVLSGTTSSTDTSSTTTTESTTTGSLLSSLTSIFSSSKTAKADDLVGTWTYTEPAVVFSSSNVLKNAGGKVASATIEKKLQKQLQKYGIKKGTMTMTFDKDGNFTQTVAGKSLNGTYSISGKEVELKYNGTMKQVLGTTQVDGNSLLIVMDATKLLSYMNIIGSLSNNSMLSAATSLVGSMDGMQCGLRLEK